MSILDASGTPHFSNDPPGVLAGDVADVLASLGLASLSERERVEAVVADRLASVSLSVRVAALRHGRLTVTADATTACFLRYEIPALLAAIESAVPGAVSDIRVRVER